MIKIEGFFFRETRIEASSYYLIPLGPWTTYLSFPLSYTKVC